MRVLGFGDNVVDRFVDRGIEYPGGNAVNVAVYARRRGFDAAYLGVFGDDELAGFVRDSIEAQGVSTEHSVVTPGHSGLSLLEVIEGDRVFIGGNEGGITVEQPITLNDARRDYVRQFNLVHSSVYSATEPLLAELRATGVLVSYDFSSEPEFRVADYVESVAPHLDLALFSCSDLSVAETWQLLDRAIASGARIALATRGVDGALITDGVDRAEVAARPIPESRPIVDTMGCGDAFLAGCMTSLLDSGWSQAKQPELLDLQAALAAGADSAWEQCFVEGAFGGGRSVRASLDEIVR